jgi:hypothetical protein
MNQDEVHPCRTFRGTSRVSVEICKAVRRQFLADGQLLHAATPGHGLACGRVLEVERTIVARAILRYFAAFLQCEHRHPCPSNLYHLRFITPQAAPADVDCQSNRQCRQ